MGKHIQKVSIHKGDVFYVPSGTVHGIGGGILIAEIQESSNVTYRVYDYNRICNIGRKRELHFNKAVQVMNMDVAPDLKQKPRMVKYYAGCLREILCRCKCFEAGRIQVTKGFSFPVMDESFQVLIFLEGTGQAETMDSDFKPVRFCKGETVFLPAGIGRCLVLECVSKCIVAGIMQVIYGYKPDARKQGTCRRVYRNAWQHVETS